jgi:hypothetical protein
VRSRHSSHWRTCTSSPETTLTGSGPVRRGVQGPVPQRRRASGSEGLERHIGPARGGAVHGGAHQQHQHGLAPRVLLRRRHEGARVRLSTSENGLLDRVLFQQRDHEHEHTLGFDTMYDIVVDTACELRYC